MLVAQLVAQAREEVAVGDQLEAVVVAAAEQTPAAPVERRATGRRSRRPAGPVSTEDPILTLEALRSRCEAGLQEGPDLNAAAAVDERVAVPVQLNVVEPTVADHPVVVP